MTNEKERTESRWFHGRWRDRDEGAESRGRHRVAKAAELQAGRCWAAEHDTRSRGRGGRRQEKRSDKTRIKGWEARRKGTGDNTRNGRFWKLPKSALGIAN
jgi:hypothetical protein